MGRGSRVGRRLVAATAVGAVVITALAGVAAASNAVSGLSAGSGGVSVPTWLYLATGGGVIAASAVLTMLMTDRDVVDGFHELSVETAAAGARRAGGLAFGALGVIALGFVVVVGFVGPSVGNVNAAVLLTFVVVRAALPMVAYAAVNPWPAIDPWRRIAGALPNGFRTYPARLGAWPAVVGLLALVWVETVTAVSSDPVVLAVAVLAYSAYTIAGGVVFGPTTWAKNGDPIAVAFRMYGAVAPIGRTDDGFELRFPGSRLGDADVVRNRSDAAFAVALVWELTYSGFVVTPPCAWLVEALVGVGVPPEIVYLATIVVGYAIFLGAYRLATARSRAGAETYLSRRTLAIRFAPPLLAIAAGYHAAHYLGFTVSLWPSLIDALVAPLSPPVNPTQLALPGWFGYVGIAAVLLGHVLAVWVAHAISFELFPAKLQAIRSQFPFVAVMVAFTVCSLWLLSLPTGQPPYAPG